MNLVIFDMGGVVCDHTAVLPEILEELKISKEDFFKFSKDNLSFLQTGTISVERFWQDFSKGFGRQITEDLWAKFFTPTVNQGTVKLIEELKEKYRVIVGTNTIKSHYDIHQSRGDYLLFDQVYASHLIGFAKPDAGFYNWILQKEACQPTDCLFIDDTQKNLIAAETLGITCIRFTNANNLRKELDKLGV